MSFGDPNNPYGQPQGQGQQPGQQPGYGYPQQAPQGVPQQGYGYPAAPPVSPYGGGYPGAAMVMPGSVKGARVMLWIMSAFNVIGGLAAIGMSFAFDSSDLDTSGTSSADAEAFANLGQGIMIAAGVISLIFAAFGIMLAVKFSSGGNGVRIGAIVWSSLAVLFSIFSLPLGIVSLVLGVLIIVFVAKSDGSAWFNRNKQQY
ncbi:hypothetical protein ACFV2S_17425 [Streptomyces sp. NPDC059695]|uniref:hypothetical protein n=1 Tax=Streptomyces sp. NPDC059695 TaxID=3346910 RepID=UPI00367B650F